MFTIDASGSLVADYTYDAWGRVLSVMNHTSACIGDLNPFRYRSYYYDAETGLYYLQRYCQELCANSFADSG